MMKPLAITMGCPVGIGPEIILKLFAGANAACESAIAAVVVGDPDVLRWCGRSLGLATQVVEWQPGNAVPASAIPVFRPPEMPPLAPEQLIWGRPNRWTGLAMGCAIEAAVHGIQAHLFSGMVTCPIAKQSLQEAGYPFPGHTEMLASLCRATDYAMMMAGDTLRVTLVTIHLPLREVPRQITTAKIHQLIALTARSLVTDFGVRQPRLAVAALNPHAGEGGMFGQEEELLISPAIRQAQGEGWLAYGPFPPDTVFYRAAAGGYDAVVCMYHDQGLIPFKLLHFKDGVNVTIGLPLVRTSVDHGTAYDIAGKGLADPASLAAAVGLARAIIANRGQVDR